jgi:signal transduction protein with GAF and PtsI domain
VSDEQSLLAAAVLAEAERAHKELLDSVVRTARALFGAGAATVFLFDEESGELVFEAISGGGESQLLGHRFPASRGIAGWVLSAQEPMTVADLSTSPVFARDMAETTGYLPQSMMAAPLLHGEAAIGVLEVLDPAPLTVGPLAAGDLLTLFAEQAAIALAVIQRNRSARRILGHDQDEFASLVTLARLIDELGADGLAVSRLFAPR